MSIHFQLHAHDGELFVFCRYVCCSGASLILNLNPKANLQNKRWRQRLGLHVLAVCELTTDLESLRKVWKDEDILLLSYALNHFCEAPSD